MVGFHMCSPEIGAGFITTGKRDARLVVVSPANSLIPSLREAYALCKSSTEDCRLSTSLRRRTRKHLDHITGHQYHALRPVLIKNHQPGYHRMP
jgi:hypothetical protein